MPIMEISIVPVGTESVSVSDYVAAAVKVLENEKEIRHFLTPMATVVEADSLEKLLDIAGQMHQAVLEHGTDRVLTTIRIDDRKDKPVSMDQKVDSVQDKLEKS